MKVLIKSSFALLLLLFVTQISSAQSKRAPYNAVVAVEGKPKVFGKIAAITDTALVMVDKKDATHYLPYGQINSIKVYKRRSDIGYTAITGALAVGAVVAAQNADDAAVGLLVGTAGTAGVITISMALHNVIHGPEVKLKASKEKIDYNKATEQLSKYVVNDASLRL